MNERRSLTAAGWIGVVLAAIGSGTAAVGLSAHQLPIWIVGAVVGLSGAALAFNGRT